MELTLDVVIQIIDKWWNTWHRFAEEDEKPPLYISYILAELEKQENKSFDIDSGVWV